MNRIPFRDLVAENLALGDALDRAYQRVAQGPSLILGAQVIAFEERWASYVGAAHCVGVGNGFDALQLSLRALGVGPGDDVLVPANTYVATWLAVSAVGARPIGVEPDAGTFNMDPSQLAVAMTPQTAAVIPVHLYGQPADMTAVLGWAREHNIAVLADAAQAHGALHAGTPLGALGDMVAWSHYPTKNLGALGDGGSITTNVPALAKHVRMLRDYGRDTDGRNVLRGLNSRLDELQASFLLAKLDHLCTANEHRQRLATMYLTELATADLTLPVIAAEATPVWHQFVVRVRDRDTVRARLLEAGVETMVHYPVPPFRQPAYADLDLPDHLFPLAERLADEVLSLPIGPLLSDTDQARVIEALHAACG